MLKKMLFTLTIVAAVAGLFIAGCESDAGNSALIGSALGAGIGQLAGGDTEATLIGAAVGGGAGYAIGNESDRKKQQQQINSVRAEQNTQTVWVTNSNGSKISVRLTKQGPGYIGPRGEYYENLPTPEELRPVYGF